MAGWLSPFVLIDKSFIAILQRFECSKYCGTQVAEGVDLVG